MARCDPLLMTEVAHLALPLPGQMNLMNSQRCERGCGARSHSRLKNHMAVFRSRGPKPRGSHGERRHAGVAGSLNSDFLYFSLPHARPGPVKSWSSTSWFGQRSLAERNKFATTAVGIKGRSRPTLQHARTRLLPGTTCGRPQGRGFPPRTNLMETLSSVLGRSRRPVGFSRRVGEFVDELADRAHNVTLLGVGQLRVNGQGDGFASSRLGVGKVAGFIPQRGEADLQVERDRVVDLGTDLPRSEVVPERVTEEGRNPDDELVVDVEIALPLDRQADHFLQTMRSKQVTVAVGNIPAQAGPGIEVSQLDSEHGCLKRVEPRIETDLVVMVLGLHAVDAKSGDPPRELRMIRRDHAAVAKAPQVLGGIEAERGDVAERPGPGAMIG